MKIFIVTLLNCLLLSLTGCFGQIAIQPIFITDGPPGGGSSVGNGGSGSTPSSDVKTLPLFTTTMLGFADFVTTKGNTVIHFRPSSVEQQLPQIQMTSFSSSSSSPSQVVRIVVNTKVSSDDKKVDNRQEHPPLRLPSSLSAMMTSEAKLPQTVNKNFNVFTAAAAQIKPTTTSFINDVVKVTRLSNDVTPSREETNRWKNEGAVFGFLDVAPIIEPPSLSDPFGDSHNDEVHVQIAEHDWSGDESTHDQVASATNHQQQSQQFSEKAPEQHDHHHKQQQQQSSSSIALPTGLVTTMGGTVVSGGHTTVHETKVIGTFIDGTYAQILESTSKIFSNEQQKTSESVATIITAAAPSTSLSQSSEGATVVRPTYAEISRDKGNVITASVIQSSMESIADESLESKNRFSRELSPTPTMKPTGKPLATRIRASRKNLYSNIASQRSRLILQRQKPHLKTITADGSVTLATSFTDLAETVTPSTVIGNKQESSKGRTRSTIRPKVSTRVLGGQRSQRNNNNDISKSRIGRLTYTPNASKYYPRRRLRLKGSISSTTSNQIEETSGPIITSPFEQVQQTEAAGGLFTTFTVTSTVTTELTQFYGPKSDTKSLVFTTTFEQPVVITKAVDDFAARGAWVDDDDDDDNIDPSEPLQIIGISTSANTQVSSGSSENEDLNGEEEDDFPLNDDISNNEGAEDNAEARYAGATPPLELMETAAAGQEGIDGSNVAMAISPIIFETVSEDFTTTNTVHQTSLLPIYDGSTTLVYTMTQSFFVTKIVHAVKTVPPKELLAFVVHRKKSPNDVNPDLNAAESEHREDFANGAADDDFLEPLINKSDILAFLNLTSNNDIRNSNDDTRLENSIPSVVITTPQPSTSPAPPVPTGYAPGMAPYFNPFLNPLAYLGLGMPPPYGAGAQEQVITTSRPVYSTETIYGTKVLPIWDGLRTSYLTTKAPSSTKVHTNYETYTTQMAGNQQQHAPGLPNFQQPMQTITTTATKVLTETITSTQVLKLMYDGYKTSYRTLLSTSETVKTLTTLETTTVPFAGANIPFFG